MTNLSDLAALPELVERVAFGTPSDGLHETAWAPLALIRASEPAARLPSVYEPSLCVVVQGRKQAQLGDELFRYQPGNFLVVSLTLPVIAQILEATPERPYLCLRIGIDPGEIVQLLTTPEAARLAPPQPAPRPLYLSQLEAPLADALLRLMRALDRPAELPVIGPLLMREITWRVLASDLGGRLRELVDGGGRVRRIGRAIELIRKQFAEPLRIDELAGQLHMSASSLHHRFKSLTTLTPLQYQKQIRLHEARRLMLAEGMEAAAAGYRVGYGSPSQFSREYSRLFGAPPRREIEQLRR